MRNSLFTCACVLGLSAVFAITSVPPAFAQNTTLSTTPAPRKHRRILHPGIESAPARNVGPSSSAAGAYTDSPISGAGNPSVPGAPSAGPSNGGGK